MSRPMERDATTMNDVSQTLDAVFDSAYALHDEAQRVANVAVVLAVRSGAEFTKAKALCRRGEFEHRIAQESRVSLRTAQRYMQLARGYPELLEPKAQPVALLPGLRHAIALLSADDEVKAEVDALNRAIEKAEAELTDYRQRLEDRTGAEHENQRLHLDTEKALRELMVLGTTLNVFECDVIYTINWEQLGRLRQVAEAIIPRIDEFLADHRREEKPVPADP